MQAGIFRKRKRRDFELQETRHYCEQTHLDIRDTASTALQMRVGTPPIHSTNTLQCSSPRYTAPRQLLSDENLSQTRG